MKKTNIFRTLLVIVFILSMLCTNAAAADIGITTATAVPTRSPVYIDGRLVGFEAYQIGGNNFFKLRDLAMALNGSSVQFEVIWDGALQVIRMESDKAYTAVGGELQPSELTQNRAAKPATSKIYVDGKQVQLTAYTINNNNYFKLREIGQALDFGVIWNSATNSIQIDSTVSYAEGLIIEKTNNAVKYSNGYYGIQVRIPEGWYENARNYNNMTVKAEESSDFDNLELTVYDEGIYRMDMIELWSKEDSADIDHVSLLIYMDLYAFDFPEDEYLDALEEEYSGNHNGYASTLLSRDTAVLDGKTFTRFKYLTSVPGGIDQYFEEYYILKMFDSEYLIIGITYWKSGQDSFSEAVKALSYFTFMQ